MPIAQLLARIWPVSTSLMLVGGYVWYRATVLADDGVVEPFAAPGQQESRSILPGSKRGTLDFTTRADSLPPQAEPREVKSYYTAPAPAPANVSPRATMSGSKSLVIDFPVPPPPYAPENPRGLPAQSYAKQPVLSPYPVSKPVPVEPPPRTIMLGSKSGAIEVTVPQYVVPAKQQTVQQRAVQQTAPQR